MLPKSQVYKVFDCVGQTNTKDLELHDETIFPNIGNFPTDNRTSKWKDFLQSHRPNVKVNFGGVAFLHTSMNSLSISDLDHVFNTSRMTVMDSSSRKIGDSTWRQNLCKDLMSLRNTFCKFPPSTDVVPYNSAVTSFLKQLSSLRLQLGYISDILHSILHHNLPSEIFSEPWYSVFHLHLDLRWYCLTCIYKLECCHLDGTLQNELYLTYRSGESLLAYHVTLLTSELFQLSISKFESVSLHDLSRTSPFHCKCVKELWFMLHMLVNEAQKQYTSIQPFRTIIRTLMNITLSDITKDISEVPDLNNCTDLPVPDRYVCSNPVAFCLWFFNHITQLHGYTHTGKYVGPTSDKITTDHSELVEILRVCMNPKNSVTEEQLRVYLPLVIELVCEWGEPNSEPVKIFWEYFHSRLNSGFFMRGTLPQNLMTSRDSGIEMLRHIESQINGLSLHSNSFALFLRFLGAHLQHCVRENKLKPWLQLKGRIYSKFSQSKMVSLTEMGLHHFACLFLTLAIRIDLKEVSRRCQEFLSLLPMKELDLPKQSIVWKAHLAFIQLHIDKGENFADIAQSLMKEVQQNSENMRLMKIFVTDLEIIFRQQNELKEQSYHVLFDNWMLPYLSHANEYDSQQVLSMVLSLIPNLPKTKSSWLLLQHLLSFAKAQYGSVTIKPKKEVSDIAAEISFLAIKDPAQSSESFAELFKYFGCSAIVNAESSCYYLIALCKKQDIMDHIKVHVREYQQLLIQSWIRFYLLLVNSDELLNKMTKILENLPDIKYLSDLSGIFLVDEEEEDNSFINFSQMLGEAYEELDEPSKQISLREKCSAYFAQVTKIIDPVLKTPHTSQDHIERIYSCVFYLVSNCGALLYMKNKGNCVLPTFITHLFLPTPLERELQPVRLVVIKKYLHRFIFCLEKLNSPGDMYISSVVKQLAVKYLPLFDINEKHPLFPCFICEAKEHILQAVSDEFLRCRGVTLHRQSETALQFLLQLLKHHITDTEIVLLVINICLGRVFEMAVFVPESNKKQAKMSYLVIQELLKHCDSDETREQFCKCMSELCKQNLAFTTTPLHKLLLFVANVHPRAMEIYLPKLWEEVKHVESRRGVAYDCALRTAMKAIETELQQRLNPERS